MGLPIITILIIIMSGISIWAFQDMNIRQKLIMHPYTVMKHKQYYRLLTSGFIHADFMHLFFNGYALHLFGQFTENIFVQVFGPTQGVIYLVLLFVLGIIVSDIPTLFRHQHNTGYFSLGASGGVSAVMFSTIILFPMLPLQFIFIRVNIPGFIMGIGYLIYSHYYDKNPQDGDNVGHSAHLYGALFGIVFTIILYPASIGLFFKQIIEHYSF